MAKRNIPSRHMKKKKAMSNSLSHHFSCSTGQTPCDKTAAGQGTDAACDHIRAEQSPRNRGKIESGGKKDCTEGNALFFFNSFELFDFLHDFFLKSRSTVYGFM